MSQADFVTRGQALVTAGQYQEAVKVCRLGLLGRPTTVEGRVVLGQALLALKRYDEVLAEMRVALELDANAVDAQVLKGEALLKKGDPAGAADVFQRARAAAPTDPRIAQLLADAERAAGRPAGGAGGPKPTAIGFAAGDSHTKHYPSAEPGDDDDLDTRDSLEEDTGGSYTRPTSLAAPSAKRSAPQVAQAREGMTPPPAVLAVGDRSGTVEVDPDRDGIELGRDDDFGEPVGPPAARTVHGHARGAQPGKPGGAKAKKVGVPAAIQPRPAAGNSVKGRSRGPDKKRGDVSSVELLDEDVVEVDDSFPPTPRRAPGPGTAVRNAVKLPSGPIGIEEPPPSAIHARPGPAPVVPPPHLAQLIANQPHLMHLNPPAIGAAEPTHAAVPLMPLPPIAAHPGPGPGHFQGPPPSLAPVSHPMAMTMAPFHPPPPGMAPPPGYPGPSGFPPPPNGFPPPPAQIAMQPMPVQQVPPMPLGMPGAGFPPPGHHQPPPQMQPPHHPPPPMHMQQPPPQPGPGFPPPAAPGARTIALSPQQQASAAVVDQLFGEPPPAPPMAAAMAPGAGPAWARSPAAAGGAPNGSGPFPSEPGAASEPPSASKPHKTQLRRRSKMQIALWVLVGAVMIGGGVFAGFQIRAMRLGKQITAAREQAMALAKTDTWQGWIGARDRLAGIAQAEPSLDNRAALARSRAQVAFEFGDGIGEAQLAVEELNGQGGLEGELAVAFLALAQGDARTARGAADRATTLAASDAAANYVTGQAALLVGDTKTATASLAAAHEGDRRALYAVGLARALAATSQWDEALAAVGAALTATPDHPAALIARAAILAEAGRVVAGAKETGELRSALEKVIAEGGKPAADQPRGVPAAQLAAAHLAVARFDSARGEPTARDHVRSALAAGVDEQQWFGDEVVDTLYAVGPLDKAQIAADRAIARWPTTRRARAVSALISLAAGNPTAALDAIGKTPELDKYPAGLAVRGQARLAAGDIDGATADFDAALKKVPTLERALAGRAAVDLANHDVEAARKRIEARYQRAPTSPLLAASYAAVLRTLGDPPALAQAQAALAKVVSAAPTPEVARAQLELARVARTLGDLDAATRACEAAIAAGDPDARLELGLVMIENRRLVEGRELLESLLVKAGDLAPAALRLEVARARLLVGEHAGAQQLFDVLANQPGVVAWQLDRERGRLALRRGDFALAATKLAAALEHCGDDGETFLLAAEVATGDLAQTALVDKLRALAPKRLAGKFEELIVRGKLALADDKLDEAAKAYGDAQAWLERAKTSKTQKPSPQREAQYTLGRAVVNYYSQSDAAAHTSFALVVEQDPSLYDAYLFLADMLKETQPERAFDATGKAVKFNPDSVVAWQMYGTLAHKLKKRAELGTAITRLGAIAPKSEALRALQALN